MEDLRGSITAIVTPMKENSCHDVDIRALEKLVTWNLEQGTKGIVVAGTTGEAPTLTNEEFDAVVQCCVKTANGKIPVIAGTGTNSTATSIERTKLAQSLGISASLIVTPYYNRPTQEGLFQHFSVVAKACTSTKFILYNVPSRTGCDMQPETIRRLQLENANIIGIKEACGKTERLRSIRALCGKNFLIYSGEDCKFGEEMLDGSSDGIVSVISNVYPFEWSSLCNAALTRDIEAWKPHADRMKDVTNALFLESNPIGVKYALASMGRISEGIRLPLLPMTSSNAKILQTAMDKMGL